MQHHLLCNISYVVIAESMGKSLKYTTKLLLVTLPVVVFVYNYRTESGILNYHQHLQE